MTNPPAVSLVMCTYGRIDCILRLINSLEAQTCADFEFIIVDQNPPGYLSEIIARASEKLHVHYLRSTPGLSRARNVGIKHCRGSIIGFPDDDCWYPYNLIARIISLFQNYVDLGIITGRTLDATGNESNSRFLSSSQPVTRANIWYSGNSNCIFVRTSVATLIGGFNETLGVGSGTPFGSGEETDFVLRALEKGVKIAFFHDLFTHHPQVDTILDASTMKRVISYSCGFGRVLQLNNYSIYHVLFRSARNFFGIILGLLKCDLRFAKFKWTLMINTLKGYFYP